MCLDETKGEVPKGDVFWIWEGGLMGFFFSCLISERSQDSTIDSRLAEFFNSLTSDNFSALLSSPSWMYARCVAHVSNPSKMCVAYTIVAPLCNKYLDIKSNRDKETINLNFGTLLSTSYTMREIKKVRWWHNSLS